MMKLRQGLILLTATLMLAFVIPGCKKNNKNDDAPGETPGKLVGMGEMAGVPTGTPFVFPANISVAGSIYGSSCDTAYRRGSGEFVDVCIGFFNSGTTDYTLTLPAGLTITADDVTYQHGIIIQDTKILLKAGMITRCGVGAYCINAPKKPSSYTVTYKIGNVSDSRLIKQLIDLLKNKKINIEEYANSSDYNDAVDIIQPAVWSITDFDGLQEPIKQEIATIPNK
ncbi:hypothetical protein EGT74_12315 [Chitinophaga lutea]|uniref:Uncharacterized protein n=1 Tax=Chitinophaga lutea TaxID=2488634 RepID=A0A3N4Q1X5_9BACT|nr:hypothetical protein [Chitinophaga lutea]RPE14248.1 hypothetical protein EGT74_12315 [Chitinophaga lutea]